MTRNLALWIPVWGAKHLDMLDRFALPSVMQPGNLPACELGRATAFVCTTSADAEAARAIVEKHLGALPLGVEMVIDQKSGVGRVVAGCLARDVQLLTVMPDAIVGDGSIGNLVRFAANRPITVAAAHLRVNRAAFMAHYPNGFTGASNAELVDLALMCAHQSTLAAWSDKDNGTEMGGVSLTRLDARTVAAIHHLPSPWLVSFKPGDLSQFSGNDMGGWDHAWPAKLVEEERLRVLASSDIFFAVELTEPNSNTTVVVPGSANQDRFAAFKLHNRTCGAMVVCLRGQA